ncbi:MAG: hypothetical protein VB035_10160 [Candidatus Fimivivens sp.]|nr:hypothetical protein [Candidatus Fimivivens sp.]
MIVNKTQVYVKVNGLKRVTAVDSSKFLLDLTGWIQIDEGFGDRYVYAQGNYFEKPLENCPQDTHNYILVDGAVRECTVEEIAGELAEISAAGLEAVKAAKIAISKTQLADYLEAHPLTYRDSKQYSVTAEKQSLLTSALARYQIATTAGVQTTLKWNATGEECTVWEYADLAALALAIAAYVEPLVGQQQAAEVAINACSTVAEVEAIVIAYGS